jgi:hypothetical protein
MNNVFPSSISTNASNSEPIQTRSKHPRKFYDPRISLASRRRPPMKPIHSVRDSNESSSNAMLACFFHLATNTHTHQFPLQVATIHTSHPALLVIPTSPSPTSNSIISRDRPPTPLSKAQSQSQAVQSVLFLVVKQPSSARSLHTLYTRLRQRRACGGASLRPQSLLRRP